MKILTKGTYYGKKKMEVFSKGIILSEYDYHIDRTDWHYHENPYFMYVLEGNVFDVNKKEKTACPSGSFLLHNWNEKHYNSKESSFARGFHIEFERDWFDQKKLKLDLWEGSSILKDPRLHNLLGKLYFEFNCQDRFSEVAIDLLLLQMCEATQNNIQNSFLYEPSWITNLKELLHEENGAITLKYLSETLGVHPVHISRAVPKYLQTTLGDYLRQEKVKKSLHFLVNSSFSLTEISYICGFSDQSHFTRTFKRYYNLTPRDFRKQRRSC